MIILSLVGTAVGSLLTGLAGSLWLLFVGRIIDGASGASVSVAQGAVTDLAPPAERPRLLGLLGAAFGVGFVLGPAVGGLATLGGTHVPFFVAAAVASVNAVVAIIRVPETLPARRQRSRRSRRHPRPRAAPTRRATGRRRVAPPRTRSRSPSCMFMATAAFAGFEATFALLGQERFGFDEGSAAAVFVVIGVVLVIVQGGLIAPAVHRLGGCASYASP